MRFWVFRGFSSCITPQIECYTKSLIILIKEINSGNVSLACHNRSYSQIRFYSRFRLVGISFWASDFSTIIALGPDMPRHLASRRHSYGATVPATFPSPMDKDLNPNLLQDRLLVEVDSPISLCEGPSYGLKTSWTVLMPGIDLDGGILA